MQDLNIFDIVIIGITLVLGLKGLFRGLIKEVFGIVGIIGAIFVASRVSSDVGNLIAPILALKNQTTIELIGFIITLIGFWIIVYLLGIVISKIFSASGLGVFDRIFGFVFGAAKVFLIFSVIAYALYQVKSFKNAIDDKTTNSIVMPHLLSVGSYIIKLDTSSITAISDVTKSVQKSVQEETVNKAIEKKVEKSISKVEETISNTIDQTEEQIKTVKEKLQSIVNKPDENKLDENK